MFGTRRGDNNAPRMAAVPMWAPDAYSRRTAVNVHLMSSTISPANRGVPGLIPGVPGMDIMRTDAWMMPQQNFRGIPRWIVDPSSKRVEPVFSFPNTAALIDPAILAMSAHQMRPGL